MIDPGRPTPREWARTYPKLTLPESRARTQSLMELTIKQRFSEDVLRSAKRLYGIVQDRAPAPMGFESFIYPYRRGGQAFVLRLAHSRRRSELLILGEIDWVNHLAAGGAAVAGAVPSENGRLVEPIDDGHGGYFLATAFVKARGRAPRKETWNEELFTAWGRALGQMHALTKGYQPARSEWKRPDWDSPIMIDIGDIPADETIVVENAQAFVEHLRTIPSDRENFGLVHQDAHDGNFFVDEHGNLTFFDFDDCAYTWFANDIAIVLFYAVIDSPEPIKFVREFMAHFMRGYQWENRLSPGWWSDLPHFFRLRELQLYSITHRSHDLNHLNSWLARFMDGRRRRLENDIPYLDMDLGFLGESA